MLNVQESSAAHCRVARETKKLKSSLRRGTYPKECKIQINQLLCDHRSIPSVDEHYLVQEDCLKEQTST